MNAPAGVNTGGLTNTLATYQGLLTVTTGGTYFFGQANDDFYQLVIDGQTVQSTGISGQAGLQAVNLTAGTHQITQRVFNAGGGGGAFILYSGPDTASNTLSGTPPVSSLQAIALSNLAYSTSYTAANGYQNAAILNNPIVIAASGASTIDGLGTDFNYAVPSLSLGNNSILTVANGTGLAAGSAGNGAFIVTGTTTITAAGATVSPTTGTFVLAGGVTDSGFGLTKTGVGNVILGASAGTFTGPLNINAGFVQLQDGAGLTTGTTTIGVATTTPVTLDLNGQTVSTTGNIILNGGAGPAAKSSNAPAGLYNSSATTASLPVGGTLSIGAATATVNASIGGFGNISVLGTIQDSVAGSPLNKVGPNTLILSNTNTFTGVLNITSGMVQLTGPNGFTSSVTNAVVGSVGTSVDLNGQTVTTAKPLTLNGAGLVNVQGGANLLGALTNTSASPATYPGNITLAATTQIGGPSLQPGVNGGITLSGTFAGAFQITKVGGNNLTLTNATSAVTTIDVQAGSVTLSGAAKETFTAAPIIRQGATVTLDNSVTAVNSRWVTPAGTFLTGTLVINGNLLANGNTAVTENVTGGASNINIGQANGIGGATITLNSAGTGGITTGTQSTSTSIFNRGAASTALFRGDSLGTLTAGSANSANIIGNATSLGLSGNNLQAVGQAGVWNAPNALIYQWALADISASGSGTGFAGYNGYNGVVGTGGIGGNTGALQSNIYGVSSIANNANNALAAAPALTALNVNTTNANATVTVGSTASLSVGQLITGTGIPANAVITAIASGTTFTISANATAESRQPRRPLFTRTRRPLSQPSLPQRPRRSPFQVPRICMPAKSSWA